MSTIAPTKPGTTKTRKWAPFLFLGFLAVGAGLTLPQALGMFGGKTESASFGSSTNDSLVYTPPSWPEPPDARDMLVRLSVGTGIVLLLCPVAIWGCRRWLQQGTKTGAESSSQMALLETLPLGNRCALHLVRIGSQRVLVGVDGAGLKSMVSLQVSFDDTLAGVDAEETPTPPQLRHAA